MDPRDELREALEHRRAEDERAERQTEELERQRRAFEAAENEVRQRLYEVTDVFLAAMAELPTERILVMPRGPGLIGLLKGSEYVVGWQLEMPLSRVLCPDGTLVRPGRRTRTSAYPPEYSTLHAWADGELHDIRGDSGEPPKDYMQAAFVQGDARSRQTLQIRLSRVQESVTDTLADLLHERGLSL